MGAVLREDGHFTLTCPSTTSEQIFQNYIKNSYYPVLKHVFLLEDALCFSPVPSVWMLISSTWPKGAGGETTAQGTLCSFPLHA